MLKRLLFISTVLILFTQSSSAQGWLCGRNSTINANGIEEGGPVTIDNSGNVYGINTIGSLLFSPAKITSTYGAFSVTDSLDLAESVVYCLNDSGNYRWAVGTYGGVLLNTICTDNGGFLYLSGHKTYTPGYFAGLAFPGTSSGDFIAKINSAGHGIWLQMLPAGIILNGIAAGPSGEIYFTGGFTTTPITFGATTISANHQEDIILGKYDSSGNPLWAMTFSGDSAEYASSISFAENGSVYIAGTSSSARLIFGTDTLTNTSAPGNSFLFVARIDTARNIKWARSIIPSSAGASIRGIATDNFGNLYCTGGYFATMHSGAVALPTVAASFSRMYIFRFDSSGQVKWASTMNNDLLSGAYSVDADNCGNIWVSGKGGYPSNAPYDPMYLARFDSSGALKDSIFLISGGDDANWMKLDKRGYLYVSGDYLNNPFVLGADTLDPVNVNEYLFTGKYIYALPECIIDTVPLHQIKTLTPAIPSYSQNIVIYPNPASNNITILNYIYSKTGKAEIYDITGRCINTWPLSPGSTEISIATLQPGIYECRIYNTGNSPLTQKLVIIK